VFVDDFVSAAWAQKFETANNARAAIAFAIFIGKSFQTIAYLTQRAQTRKKPKCGSISAFKKNWRQPTLAEAIQPLPSARLRLTAEFGMGSGPIHAGARV
jgi:hypothetical protein